MLGEGLKKQGKERSITLAYPFSPLCDLKTTSVVELAVHFKFHRFNQYSPFAGCTISFVGKRNPTDAVNTAS